MSSCSWQTIFDTNSARHLRQTFKVQHSIWLLRARPPSLSSKRQKASTRTARCLSNQDGQPVPKDFERTLLWARQSFEEHVAPEKDDSQIQLALASLLIAVEDTAAAEIHHANSPPLMEQWLIHNIRHKGTDAEREWERKSEISEAPVLWDLGSASTWNLERLEALAEEIQAKLRQLCNLDEQAAMRNDQRGKSDSQGISGFVGSDEEDIGLIAKRFPMLAITAINEVLFERQGYQGRANHGDVRGLQLPYVMERGDGSSAVLTILYVEICERIGLPMDPILCEGSYGLLRHRDHSLKLGGEEVVVDVYSKGVLFLLKEVQEVFALPEEIPKATKRDLLGALLGDLRDLHWAKAVRCGTEVSLMIPISTETVLSGDIGALQGYQIQRSVAAAERACKVCPGKAQDLKLAVLLYFGGQYSRALDIVERGGYCIERSEKLFETKLKFLTR